ncbi:MAG: tRNA 2-thiouridine(34) synthase MnmA [Victivallales bacterium]|nr:tRNA 2-thiouridine(34) synthase MnmA [Victivallales bacterium]
MKILVGMSGGVDSATAAALLHSQGHEVTGVTMRLWREDNHLRGGSRDACYGPNEAEDVESACTVCNRIGIPFHEFDCSHAYESTVIGYFREEYLAGRTPNPCVRCNAAMKFGLLPEMARQSGLEFDCFATGHYARLRKGDDGRMQLLMPSDRAKDQSYFLCGLSQTQLSCLMFPLGDLSKTEVRRMACDFGLPVNDRPDSQDFYSGDTAELIGRKDIIGEIVDDATGKFLGHHTGYWKYTIGQRKGLGVASTEPLYVIGINACRNEVRLGRKENAIRHKLRTGRFNWVSISRPEASIACEGKVRSVQNPVPCMLNSLPDGSCEAEFPEGIFAIAPGQAAVFYQGEMLLGGGFILEAL